MIIFAGIFGIFEHKEEVFKRIKLKLSKMGYNYNKNFSREFLQIFTFSPNEMNIENYYYNENMVVLVDGHMQQWSYFLIEENNTLYYLWNKYGKDFLKKLEGSYSLLFADINKKEVLLAKDIFGSKNLFYHHNEKYLIFSNDLNILKSFKEYISLSINTQSLYDYTALLFIPSPNTFYSEISSLMPAEYLYTRMLEKNKIEVEKNKYHIWEITGELEKDKKKCLQKSEILMDKAIEKYLKKDNNYSSLLSGGIDSSLISYFAKRYLKNNLHTFNVKFLENKYDETWAATKAAEAIGSSHLTFEMGKENVTLEEILKIMGIAGQPYGDSSLIPLYFLLNYVREYSENVLCGEGGDEAFWINPYVLQYIKYYHMPYIIRKFIYGYAKKFKILKHPIQFADMEISHNFFRYIYSWIREEEHNNLWRGHSCLPIERHFYPQWDYKEESKKLKKHYLYINATEILIRLNLPNDYLFKLEIAGKANGINMLNPFLDKDIFMFSFKIPFCFKKDKKLLRELAKKYFPKEITKKKKWGFGFPMDYYINIEEKLKIKNFIIEKLPYLKNYINNEVVVDWVEKFCGKRPLADLSRMGLYQRIYMLLSLCLFL